MELKKFGYAILASLCLLTSAAAYASSTGDNAIHGNIEQQPIGGNPSQFVKCPPFCH